MKTSGKRRRRPGHYSLSGLACPFGAKDEISRSEASGFELNLQRFAKRNAHPKSVAKPKRKLTGARRRQFRALPRNQPLERGARFVNEGQSVPRAARAVDLAPSTLRRYLHKTGLARKTKSGRIAVPRYRARYWLRVFTEGRLPRLAMDGKNAKRAGEFMHAAGEALEFNDPSFIATFVGDGVTDVEGVFHPFETRMNTLYRLRHEQAADETFDLEYEILPT